MYALFHTCFVSVCCVCLLVKQECTVYLNKKTEKNCQTARSIFQKDYNSKAMPAAPRDCSFHYIPNTEGSDGCILAKSSL